MNRRSFAIAVIVFLSGMLTLFGFAGLGVSLDFRIYWGWFTFWVMLACGTISTIVYLGCWLAATSEQDRLRKEVTSDIEQLDKLR